MTDGACIQAAASNTPASKCLAVLELMPPPCRACAFGFVDPSKYFGHVPQRLRQRAPSAQEVHRKTGTAHHGIARLLGQTHHPSTVDSDQIAAPLAHLAGN